MPQALVKIKITLSSDTIVPKPYQFLNLNLFNELSRISNYFDIRIEALSVG